MAFTTETGNKNIEILLDDLSLKQRGGSSIIFENENLFVLSPSVQNQYDRFDIGLVNIDIAKKNQKKAVFIARYFDDLLVGDLEEFLDKMTINTLLYTHNTTQKWQYNVRKQGNRYFITLQKAKGLEFNLTKMNREKLMEYIGILKENQIEPNIKQKLYVEQSFSSISIDHIHSFITSKGFSYSLPNIKNLYLSLRSKPFVIISGISGTGKSKIAQLFAESVGATEDNGQFKLIPVRPDWSDGSELLGYLDLKGEFQKGPLTEMVEHAMDHPDLPHFVLLDEMNLARVEYYFSDVLSVMESRKRDGGEITSSQLLDAKFTGRAIKLTDNLYLIGTVNMDETTHPFSKKVLDRANTIEFNEIYLESFNFLESHKEVDAQRISNEQLEPCFISLKDVYLTQKILVEEVSRKLAGINNFLEPINAQVGYRVRDEICFYMVHNKEANLLSENEALDFCYMQKILPRISGGQVVEVVLMSLKALWTVQTEEGQKLPYPRSYAKVEEMLGRLKENGFTSFWIA